MGDVRFEDFFVVFVVFVFSFFVFSWLRERTSERYFYGSIFFF